MKETIKYKTNYGDYPYIELKNHIGETFSVGDRVACTLSVNGYISIGIIESETAKSILIVDEKTNSKRRLQKDSVYTNLRKL
tara:strand:- start:103 stop:348 length:246 start_codon:yes stop_codon:yes gene_type:complete